MGPDFFNFSMKTDPVGGFRIRTYCQEQVMTPSQRLKYSILISLVVLGIMFGLCIAFAASTFFLDFFGFAGGAEIG